MVTLNDLPPEILISILNLIIKTTNNTSQNNNHSNFIRTNSSLIPISLISKRFNFITNPILNSQFNLETEFELNQFLSNLTVFTTSKSSFHSSYTSPPTISIDFNRIKVLNLLNPASALWELNGNLKLLLDKFITKLSNNNDEVEFGKNLLELKIGGIDSCMLNYLEQWLAKIKKGVDVIVVEEEMEIGIQPLSSSIETSTQSNEFMLLNLELDFEKKTTRTYNAEVEEERILMDQIEEVEEIEIELQESKESLIFSCLTIFPRLEKLRISYLPPTAINTTPDDLELVQTAKKTNLLSLELEESTISDSTLISIFNLTPKLRQLSIKNCRGFSPTGMRKALRLILPRLESLTLIFDPPLISRYISSTMYFPSTTSPLHSSTSTVSLLPLFRARTPPTSPTNRNSPTSFNEINNNSPLSLTPSVSILTSLLDPLLPSCNSLLHLSLTGPLLTLLALQSTLTSNTTPSTTTNSISAPPIVLFLPKIKSMNFNQMYQWNLNCLTNNLREVFVKCKERGIELNGSEFGIWRGRMEWVDGFVSGDEQIIDEEVKVESGTDVVRKRKKPSICL